MARKAPWEDDVDWTCPDVIGSFWRIANNNIAFGESEFRRIKAMILDAKVSPATYIEGIDLYGNEVGIKKSEVTGWFLSDDMRWRRSIITEYRNAQRRKEWLKLEGGWKAGEESDED